ncbi:MAG TPA: protein-disulfide reductase DsbD domain-containing protein [Paenirhodobacter sp.]
MTRLAIPFLCLCLAAPVAALAQQVATPTLPPGLARVGILPGWRDPDGSRVAAIRIQLDPGWKTYWRVPGEAGIPPELDFTGSRNIAELQVIWPVPTVFDQDGIRSVGYHDALVLPIRIIPRDPTEPVMLDASLDFGICRNICVPVSTRLDADLTGAGQPDAQIAQALEDVPVPRPGRARCTTEPVSDGTRVTARIDLPEGRDQIALFELRSSPMWVSESVMHREGGVLVASADFVPDAAQPFDLDRADLRITVLGNPADGVAKAIEIDGCSDD